MNTLEFKEGQTYICKRDDLEWWTEGKEYKVQTFYSDVLYITDDDGYNWYVIEDMMNDVFKLKEQTFDLNKLTTAQLKEYIGLLEKDLKSAESSLNEFMERTNKLIKLTRIDETAVYVNLNHIAAFYHNDAWEYTIVLLVDGTQLDAKDSVESIAKYF